jgi:hypothetical protein
MKIYSLFKKLYIRKSASPLIEQEQYLSYIYKDIKKIENRNRKEYIIEIDKKNNEHKEYLYAKKKLDSVEGKGINYFEVKKSVNGKRSYLNIRDNQSKLVKLFNIKNENKMLAIKRYIKENIIEEHSNDIRSRKVSNNLVEPYYFFTARYNEKSMPSQIKHWTSSAYNFFRPDKTGNNHLDLFTSKLIKLFFRVKYLRRKFIWDTKLLDGFKINPNLQLIKDMNVIISYTSNRTSQGLRKLYSYPKALLSLNWLTEQIKSSESLRNMIRRRKLEFFVGFYPKKKSYLRKLGRVLISKPLFKHTAFNLIIDLFVYNNKRYKYRMLKNIVVRRGTYKYMYSMYVNYSRKVSETLNRPRFFYINLIEPKTYKYYSEITNNFGNMYIYKLYPYLRYTLLLLIKNFLISRYNNSSTLGQSTKAGKSRLLSIRKNIYSNDKIITEDNIPISLDTIKKDTDNINDINNQNNKEIISFKRYSERVKNNWIKKNELRNYRLNKIIFKFNKKRNLNLYYINKKIVAKIKIESEGDDKKKGKKYIKDVNLKFLIYKKYLEELDRKSSKPVDLKTLSLWNTEGLGKNYRTPTGIKREIFNNKNKQRFTYAAYRKNKLKNNNENKYMTSPQIRKSEIWDKRQRKFNKVPIEEFIFSYNNNYKKNDKKIIQDNKKTTPSDRANNISPAWSNVDRTNQDNSLIIKEDSKIYNNLGQDGLNKEDYIKEVYFNNSNILNGLFSSFYFNDNNDNINNNNNKNVLYFENREKRVLFNSKLAKNLSIGSDIFNISKGSKNYSSKGSMPPFVHERIDSIELNSEIERINKHKKIVTNRLAKSKKIDSSWEKKIINSKNLWDRLDSSIINILYDLITNTTSFKNNVNDNAYVYKATVNILNKFKDYGDIWYIMYYTSYVKKEFYNINREVLLPKNRDIIPFTSNKINDNFYYNENERSSNVKYYENVENNFAGNFWPAFYTNKREDNMEFRINFSEKIFKPYYRYMLPIFIRKLYIDILWNLPYWVPGYFFFKNLNIKCNEFMVYNYVSVKILLDLLQFNYRYLIRVKPKYQFINKLRYYQTKLKKININSWVASIRYITRLRKTPKNFWLRYHKVASYYYSLVVKNAEIDTDRKIFVPFVIYFEDILFNIYGKWALIRLWPLKRYYLSSYILAGRVLLLIVWRRKHKLAKFNFQRITSKLITGMRVLQIQKAYDYYIKNYSSWPQKLITKLSDTDVSKSVTYNRLEFNESKIFRLHTLNTYNLFHNNSLAFYLPAVKNNYINDYYNNISYIRRKFKIRQIENLSINRIQLIYYWLRPLKNYISKLNRNIDISGIKIRITGRAGIRRNNLRSLYKTKFYGNLMGPLHYVARMKKPKTITLPRLRGYLRSNIDYAFSVSKSKNGSISFKVWISSVISTDVHELLLHLVRIKGLYSQLVNRYFVVNPIVQNVKNDYLLFPIKERFNKRRKKINKK